MYYIFYIFMIGISKLYCGTVEPSDALRYNRKSLLLPSHLLQFSEDKKPVIVWNITNKCNLKCIHCYAKATTSFSNEYENNNELTTTQGFQLIDELADYGVPVLLFSGGEPLLRSDIFDLLEYAQKKGIRTVLSTNGTLINDKVANKLKNCGLSYVGISFDGLHKTNDMFRGVLGTFKKSLNGLKICQKKGIKVGIRFTINKLNMHEINDIFDLMINENIPRACFYHLVYSGRGNEILNHDLTHEETKSIMDVIIENTKKAHQMGIPLEILTVDNHCDGPYLYLKLKKENPNRAKNVYELLKMNGGNSSGIGIGCISWDGEVYADQFWRHYSFGNIKNKPFSIIWNDTSDPIMNGLKNRKPLLIKYTKRCKICKWIDICNGNLRVRAEYVNGKIWSDDPACYLTEDDIRNSNFDVV